MHGAAATPRALIPALAAHGKKAGLKNVRVRRIVWMLVRELNDHIV